MDDGFKTIDQAIEEIEQGKTKFPRLIDGQMVHTPEEALENYRKFKAMRERVMREIRDRWLQSPGGKLCAEMYRKFEEYRAYLDKNPNDTPHSSFVGTDFHEHWLFKQGLMVIREYEEVMREVHRERAEKNLKNLRRAHETARCRHRHADGRRCGSPRVRGKKYCHWHLEMEEARAAKLDLGPMEDPDSIQMAIMKLQRAVIDGTLDAKTTGQLAYTIQLAAWNVTRTKMAREAKEESAE